MFNYDENDTIDDGNKLYIIGWKEANKHEFSYLFERKGTSTSFGLSAVHRLHVLKIELVEIGSQAGCVDTRIVKGVLSTTASIMRLPGAVISESSLKIYHK